MTNATTGIILALVGLLSMIGTAFNWRFVTHSGKLFNRLFGDTIAWIIYFGVGILLFVKGIELAIGASWLPF